MQWTRFTEADSLDSMLAFTDHTLIMARLNTVAWVLFLAMACAVPTARHNRLEAEVKALEVGVKAGKPVMTAIDENKHVSNKRGAKNGTVADLSAAQRCRCAKSSRSTTDDRDRLVTPIGRATSHARSVESAGTRAAADTHGQQ